MTLRQLDSENLNGQYLYVSPTPSQRFNSRKHFSLMKKRNNLASRIHKQRGKMQQVKGRTN